MQRAQFFAGLKITSLGTLASRALGMVRDMATAALLGLASGGVMDAFVIAFRIPNLFRRLFGEGALAASYLPVFAERLEHDRPAAWQLASVVLALLSVVLVGLLLVAEGLLAGAAWLWGDRPGVPLVIGLSAVTMPYMVAICLTAQLAATLHALGHFAMPALAPVILNVCWLIGVWFVAPLFAPDKQAQAYVLAGAVLAAGVLQVAIQLPPLRRAGFRFDFRFQESREAVGRIARAMIPMMFGLAITQLNTLVDALLAWGLAATPETGPTIEWLGGEVQYPLEQGAAAALYYGERLYQFPVGILGIAVATVIFPLLSRHAARGDHESLGADLTLGLRLVLLLALPATAGLMLLAEPIAVLLFQRGEFTEHDAARTAQTIVCYGAAVWAYCALPVIVRGYYAVGDRLTPVRLGAAMVGLNLTLSLVLLWPWAEMGLASATSIAAGVQTLLLAALFSRHGSPLDRRSLARSAAAALAATAVMSLACLATMSWFPGPGGLTSRLGAVLLPVAASLIAYFVVIRTIARSEYALLVSLGRHAE